MSWVAAGKTLPGSADSLGIILGHNAPFPTPLPSCWGMNMHPVIEVRRQLEPVTWQISPGPVSITARHSLLRVVCDLERTWSWKARKRAQILDPALPPGVDVILSILCVCVWIFLNPRSQNKEQKKRRKNSPHPLCAIHRGSCPFKPLNATQSPHKSRRLSYAWAPMTTVLSVHNFLWGMIRVAKVAVKSLSFKTTKGKRAQEPKHIGRDAQSARRNPTPSAKQWRQMWCGFDEWYSLVTVSPPSPLLLGFTIRLTPWTNAMRAHLFFFFCFFCALVAKYVFLCLFPALLFAVSPAD